MTHGQRQDAIAEAILVLVRQADQGLAGKLITELIRAVWSDAHETYHEAIMEVGK